MQVKTEVLETFEQALARVIEEVKHLPGVVSVTVREVKTYKVDVETETFSLETRSLINAREMSLFNEFPTAEVTFWIKD